MQPQSRTLKRRVNDWKMICVTLTHQKNRCINGYCSIADLRGSEEHLAVHAVPRWRLKVTAVARGSDGTTTTPLCKTDLLIELYRLRTGRLRETHRGAM